MIRRFATTIWSAAAAGKLSDVYLSDITAQLEKQVGFSIDGYDLKLQYLCPECRSQESDSPGPLQGRGPVTQSYHIKRRLTQ